MMPSGIIVRYTIGFVLLLNLSCSHKPNDRHNRLAALRQQIEHEFNTTPGTFALGFLDLQTGDTLFINAHERFHAASTMKTPVMIELYRQATAGKLSLDDSVLITTEFKSIVDGSPYTLDISADSETVLYKQVGKRLSISQLIYLMITQSSNLATNILIELVGADSVTATMHQLGAPDIEVLRGVEDIKAFDKGLNNTTTAYDLVQIMAALARGKAVSSSADKEMVGILLDQHFNAMIPALLPDKVRVAHKTGGITGVRHDSGIVYLPDGRAYVLVLLSKDLQDTDKGVAVLARISRLVYDYMMATATAS